MQEYSTDIAVPKIRSRVRSAYSSLELGETLPVTITPLLIYHCIGERLAICEITGNDCGGGGGGDGGSGGGGMPYQVMGTWIYSWFYKGKGTLGKVDPVLYYLMS
jgi:hypothetical protein